MLPFGVTGIVQHQLIGDRKPFAIGTQRGFKVAVSGLHITNLAVRHAKIALPAGVAGIGLRQPGDDREALIVRFERVGQIPSSELYVPNKRMARAQIVLPLYLPGLDPASCSAIAKQSQLETSALARSPCATCTSPILRHGEVTLIVNVAWVGFRELLRNQ